MKKKDKKGNYFIELLRRDIVYIILLMMCVGAMLYIFWEANDFETTCNEYYEVQMETCGCFPAPFDGDFNPVPGWEPPFNTS